MLCPLYGMLFPLKTLPFLPSYLLLMEPQMALLSRKASLTPEN